MSSSRRVYTKGDFLDFAVLVRDRALPAEAAKRFDVIEVVDPAAAAGLRRGGERGGEAVQSAETSQTAPPGPAPVLAGGNAKGRGAEAGVGANERRAGGPREESRAAHDRFAPPPRGWRGSRDQETFEEGIKYELERNAAHNRKLKETIAKENGKDEEQRAKKVEPPAPREDEKGNDEIERLIAGIAMRDEPKANNTRRSRFFGVEAPSNQGLVKGWENTSDANIWSQPPAAFAQKDFGHASGAAPNSSLGAQAGGNAMGSVAIAGGVSNLPGMPFQNAPGSLGKPSMGSMAVADPSGAPRQDIAPQSHIVRAEDLEQMLQSGRMPTKDLGFPQEKAKGVIQASELEPMLLRQARGGGAPPAGSLRPLSMPGALPTQPASGARPPAQQIPHPVPGPLAPIGGMGLAPQPWMQGGNPMLHPAPPGLPSGGKMPMQTHLAVPNAMPMSLMMNPQGQFIASTQPQFFLPGGQQPPVVYRRPDGTMYMPPPPANLSPFPTNAQCLYQQQQHHQRH